MTETTFNQLARQVVVLEEKMNTKHAEYRTDIATFTGETRGTVGQPAAEIRAGIEQMNAKTAERDANLTRREMHLLLIIVSLIVPATAVLGLLIKLQQHKAGGWRSARGGAPAANRGTRKSRPL